MDRSIPSPDAHMLPIQIPDSAEWIARVRKNAEDYMRQYESCSQSILKAFMTEFGISDPMVMASAGAFHGGMSPHLICGAYSGGLMVLGLLMGRRDIKQGIDALSPIVIPAQDLIVRLHDRLQGYTCGQLTETDFNDSDQRALYYASGGQEKCIAWIGDTAEEIALFIKHLAESGSLFIPKLQ